MKKLIAFIPVVLALTLAVSVAMAATINGTAGDDVLTGTTNVDTIKGFGGQDDIYGDAGGDTIWGGSVEDWIEGGSGADVIYGGEPGLNDPYADTIYGNNENDSIFVKDGFGGDFVDCGAGTQDSVSKDASDTAVNCENVS